MASLIFYHEQNYRSSRGEAFAYQSSWNIYLIPVVPSFLTKSFDADSPVDLVYTISTNREQGPIRETDLPTNAAYNTQSITSR